MCIIVCTFEKKKKKSRDILPEFMKPVLRPRTALCCGDELNVRTTKTARVRAVPLYGDLLLQVTTGLTSSYSRTRPIAY